jgi:hypothetical protein
MEGNRGSERLLVYVFEPNWRVALCLRVWLPGFERRGPIRLWSEAVSQMGEADDDGAWRPHRSFQLSAEAVVPGARFEADRR